MITGYPDKNSLKEALNTEFSVTALKRLCKHNGVFLLSNKKEDITNTAHLFYWGFEDINRISQLMEDAKNYKKSFRLILEKDDSFAIDDESTVFNDFLQLITHYRSGVAIQKKILFDSFFVQNSNGQPHIKACVEYKRKRKGRVKLMDEISQRFSFDAFQKDNNIVVDVIFDDRSSVQVARSIITDSISITNEFRIPKQISLKGLTTAERVDLFDRFFTYHFDYWMIDAVRNIKVQMSESLSLDDESDDDAEEVENNVLAGIESALFAGSGLRTNPIVVDAVNKGYFFPKATVMLEHRIDALKLLLDISFNTDDLVLELSILSTYEIEDERAYKNPIPPEEQENALQYFHEILVKIYDQILIEREAEN